MTEEEKANATCVLDIGLSEFNKGKTRVVRAWLDDPSISRWYTESLSKPKKVPDIDWDKYRMQIDFNLLFDFQKLVDSYRNGKHGITEDDVFGLYIDDHMCAVRRAIRDVKNADIIEDVSIRLCIAWGLRWDSLPKEWKGLPKGWTR